MSKTTFDSVIYAGIFLTEDSKELVKQSFGFGTRKDIDADIMWFGHHVTLYFKPTNYYLHLLHDHIGRTVDINPKRYIRDKNCSCVTVDTELTRDLFMVRSMHLTICTWDTRGLAKEGKGIAPAYSNDLILMDKFNDPNVIEAVNLGEAPELKGKVGVFTSTLKEVTDPTILLKGSIAEVGNLS